MGDTASARQGIRIAEAALDEAMEDFQEAAENFFKCVKKQLREGDAG